MSISRLTPNQMFDYAFYHIVDTLKINKCRYKIKAEVSKDKQCYGARIILKDKKQEIVLLNPVSDYQKIEIKRNVGTASLQNTLQWMKMFSQSELQKQDFIIPLAQCGDEFRRHWTCLLFTNKNWYFYDPKREKIFGGVYQYSLESLKSVLEENQFTLHKITYVNCQGDIDYVSCGYYVSGIIGEITNAVLENQDFDHLKDLGKRNNLRELVVCFQQYYPLLFDPYYNDFITSEIRSIRSEDPTLPPPDLGVEVLDDSDEEEVIKLPPIELDDFRHIKKFGHFKTPSTLEEEIEDDIIAIHSSALEI